MLFTDSDEFLNVVRLMRTWAPEFRVLGLYAANFWDDARLNGEAAEPPKKEPHLKIVR